MTVSTRARSSKKSRGFLVQKPQGQITQRVQAVGPEHFGILCVDGAKARSKFMLCDFYGAVLIEPTWLPHTQDDFRAAIDRVRQTMRQRDLKDIVVAIERTGTYHRPVQHAFRQASFETRLVHPYATNQYRQPADPGNKTDDTDLAAIFRATVNGFGLLESDWPDNYLQLQQLARQRRDLVHKTSTLRAQIKETLHQLMPGYAELFGNHFFDTPVALPLARLTGSAQAILDAGIMALSKLIPTNIHYRMSTLANVVAWARTAPAVKGPTQLLRHSVDRLADDFLKKTSEIRALEQQSVSLLVETPYILLLALPGLNVVCSVDLAGELGPITHYANPNGITGRAGLAPSRYQSDKVDNQCGPLRRRANRRLRAALVQAADNLIRHNNYFQGKAKLWQRAGKDPRWIRVKIAKSFSRLAFVILTGAYAVPHPACQPRHAITEKLLAFHGDHRTPIEQTLADIDRACAHWTPRTHQEETRSLQDLLDNPTTRRRRGPVAIAEIIPLVLARMGLRVLQSSPEEQDPD